MRRNVVGLIFILAGFAVTAGAQTSANVNGSQGDVIVNGDAARTGSGVVLRAKPATASISAQTGTASTDSYFSIFNSANTELLRVRSDGNVGIGTTSPESLLHLRRANGTGIGPNLILENSGGTINDQSALTFSSVNAFRAQIRSGLDSYSAAGNLTFSTGVYTLQDRMVITPSGSVKAINMEGHADLVVASGDEPGLPHSPMLQIQRMNGAVIPAQLAAYGLWIDPADRNNLKLLYSADSNAISRQSPKNLMTIEPVSANGGARLTFHGSIVGAVYQDLAEWVPSTTDVAPGTVVVLNTGKTNEVMASERAYDSRVAGVVSAQPGILLGPEGEGREMIATTGRVRVKVVATKPIEVGDLLVSSDRPGMAMKSEPLDLGGVAIHRPGTIIGKALEPLESGEGEILVLLSMQ